MKERQEFTNRIKQRFRDGKPFVVYHHPAEDRLKAWFPKFAEIKTKGETLGSGFLFSPFDPGSSSVLFPLETSEIFQLDLSERALLPVSERIQDRSEVPSPDKAIGDSSGPAEGGFSPKERHLELVRDAIDHIVKGNASKIVVSRREEVGGLEIDPVDIFYKLVDTYPHAFTYLWHHPGIGLWCGASPETLLRIRNRTFWTMALAGTQVYKGLEEVAWGAKEMKEQQLVTDMIEREMAGILSRISSPYTQRAGHLLHLRTDLEGEVPSGAVPGDLIAKLHPTAAVCGMPRDRAYEFILRSEGYAREYYTGFLGEIEVSDEMDSNLFVNLRCMRLFPEEKKAWIYMGGGITAASDPEKEWEETVAKSKTMKRVFS